MHFLYLDGGFCAGSLFRFCVLVVVARVARVLAVSLVLDFRDGRFFVLFRFFGWLCAVSLNSRALGIVLLLLFVFLAPSIGAR